MKNEKNNTPKSTPGKAVNKKRGSSNKLSSFKELMQEAMTPMSVLKEPHQAYSITCRIRSIGNSKGVILSNRVIEAARLSTNTDLLIRAAEGVILITVAEPTGSVNTDLSSWDSHFKNAIKGNEPESDEWEGVQNLFDKEEWI